MEKPTGRPRYLEFRDKYELKERRNFTCEACGEKFEKHQLQVHHRRVPVHLAKKFIDVGEPLPNELVTSPRNAEILCGPCHKNADRRQQAFLATTFGTVIALVLAHLETK